MTTKQAGYWVGFDLGGTKMMAAILGAAAWARRLVAEEERA